MSKSHGQEREKELYEKIDSVKQVDKQEHEFYGMTT